MAAPAHAFHFSRRLNESDANFFFLGRRRRANVAMVMVALLPREFSFDELVEECLRYEEDVPRFADFLQPAPLSIGPPVWMPLPEEERKPEYYGREVRLGPGAGWSDVFAEVDRIQSAPFRPGRAPWEATIVNGTPGAGSALVLKVHHVFSDGTALAVLFAKVFARHLFAASEVEVTIDPPLPAPGLRGALRDRRAGVRRWLARLREALPELSDPEARRREVEAMGRALRPPRRWPLGAYSRVRRLDVFSVPVAAWYELAEKRGGGPNELYLALVARAVRRAFDAIGADERPLRVAMPVDLRGWRSVQDGGNDVGVSVVELSGGPEDLRDLGAVRERAAVAKQEASSRQPTLVDQALVDLLPGPLRAAAEFRQGAACDALASSIPVPGNGELLGVPIEKLFMIAPAIGQAVSFSLTTYGEHLYLAANADVGILPSPFTGYPEETLREVFGNRFESFSR